MHIKTVNQKGEYKCVKMGHNDPIQVYWGKGYEAIYSLSLFLAIACANNVYLGFDRGCSHKLFFVVVLTGTDRQACGDPQARPDLVGGSKPKPRGRLAEVFYQYKRFRSQIFVEAISIWGKPINIYI